MPPCRALQAEGIIPADDQPARPDGVDGAGDDSGRAAEARSGSACRADFGTVQLVRADRLEAARTVVRVFDLLVSSRIVVTIVLFVAAALVARNRLRAVVLLGVGAVIALLWRGPASGASRTRSSAPSPTDPVRRRSAACSTPSSATCSG